MRKRNYQGHAEKEDYDEAGDGNLGDDTTGTDVRPESNPEEEEMASTEEQTWPQERKDIKTRPYRKEPCYCDPAKRYVYISRSTLGPFKGAFARKPLHKRQLWQWKNTRATMAVTGNYGSDATNVHCVHYNDETGM
eukprot:gene43081-57309_t